MNVTANEMALRVQKIVKALRESGAESILLRSIPSWLYLTGTVGKGSIFISASEGLEAAPIFFLERPLKTALIKEEGGRIYSVRKPELIPDILKEHGLQIDEQTVYELGYLDVLEYQRLAQLSPTGKVHPTDGASLMRQVRSIKTEEELTELRRLAEIHMEIYRLVPELYQLGMTDRQLQHVLEYQMRRRGSIGVFRAFGPGMEIFMGNLITGDNAEAPAPYDFAMGGGGVPAMPFGANGTLIEEGHAVMVDMAGNYGHYCTDITRTYALGQLSPLAQKAHDLSIALHEYFMSEVKAGVEIASVYKHCMAEVERTGLTDYFMGTEFQSKFVGHGIGIEINEPPVLTPRWKGAFQVGLAIAFEPKFVIPQVGAVGVENSYIIHEQEAENITPLPMEVFPLR